jgi:hypothetical protein
MPALNWIGKDAVLNHHKEVPFRLLKCNDISIGVMTHKRGVENLWNSRFGQY